jgi:hypothetical protein
MHYVTCANDVQNMIFTSMFLMLSELMYSISKENDVLII